MRRKIIMLAAAAILLTGLLAGCDSGPAVEAYPGEFDTPYSLGEMFTINITDDTDTTRHKYAVCFVTLEVGDADILPAFEDRLHRLRETVIFVIGSKPVSKLSTEEQKALVLEEIVERINEEFNTTAVHRADFSDFYFK